MQLLATKSSRKTLRGICFSLSACAYIMLGMHNLIFIPWAYRAAAVVSFAIVLFFCRKGLAPAPLSVSRSILVLTAAIFAIAVRCQFFHGASRTCLLLAAGSIYAVFYILAILLGTPPAGSLPKTFSHRPSWVVWGMLLLTAFAFTFFYSICAPLVPRLGITDHTIFYVIGKAWNQGFLPYTQVFDHKGPLIFFLYALGQRISSQYGIYLLQTIALWISLCFAYRIAWDGKRWDIWGIMTIASLLLAIYKIDYGHAITEEFCLPFLMASTYCASKFFLDSKTCVPAHAAVYGVTIAAALMTRATNAIAVCVYVACIFVMLLVRKQFRVIMANIVYFLIGFLGLCLPFVIYFSYHGALPDMLWGTLLYNLQYAENNLANLTAQDKITIFFGTWPAWSFLLLSVINWKKEDASFLIPNMLAAAAALYVTASGNVFPHYYIVLLPFVPLSLLLLKRNLSASSRTASAAACVLVLAMAVSWCGKGASVSFMYQNRDQLDPYESASLEITSQIPADERDSVIGYNTNSLFYLYTDLLPCYKYFTMQDWQSGKSDRMIQENADYYRSQEAKWLIVENGIELEEIKAAIEENYTQLYCVPCNAEKDQNLILYHVN